MADVTWPLEHSTDGGKTWEPTTARRGSILWGLRTSGDHVYADGFGNLYRSPKEISDGS